MHVVNGVARMNLYALTEEERYMRGGRPSLKAKQFGELTMAYMDGSTVPFLWRYANRFVLFDHVFQTMVGPSTPGNLSIIAAQSGQTQAALHTNELYHGDGTHGAGEPVVNDSDPFWGFARRQNCCRSPAGKSQGLSAPRGPIESNLRHAAAVTPRARHG